MEIDALDMFRQLQKCGYKASSRFRQKWPGKRLTLSLNEQLLLKVDSTSLSFEDFLGLARRYVYAQMPGNLVLYDMPKNITGYE